MKFDAHVLHQLHLLVDQVVRHRRGVAGVVFVAMGAAQQQALAVQLEWTVLDEFGVANAEGLARDILSARAVEGDVALIEMRRSGAP